MTHKFNYKPSFCQNLNADYTQNSVGSMKKIVKLGITQDEFNSQKTSD